MNNVMSLGIYFEIKDAELYGGLDNGDNQKIKS